MCIRDRNPVEKQAIFENHHEPIIDKETWERVQELRKQRKRPNRYLSLIHIFRGFRFFLEEGALEEKPRALYIL